MQSLSDFLHNSMTKKGKKVFISHNSKDREFGDALLDLIVSLIGDDTEKIFYSSRPKYGVQNNGNIIETMKEQYEKNDLFFIVISSPRYYDSPKSLNEMGAAWVLNSKNIVFLTRDSDVNNLRGVYDNASLALQVNQGKDTKERLDMFSDDLLSFFGISKKPEDWGTKRDEFIRKVNEIKYDFKICNESIQTNLKHERDVKTLKELLSSISSDLIQDYFKNPEYIDDRLPLSYEIWCDIYSSMTFNIYDKGLNELFQKFWKPWSELMSDNYKYYGVCENKPNSYKFFGLKCDTFENPNDETRFNYILDSGNKISKALSEFYQYIIQNFEEVDIKKLNSEFEENN